MRQMRQKIQAEKLAVHPPKIRVRQKQVVLLQHMQEVVLAQAQPQGSHQQKKVSTIRPVDLNLFIFRYFACHYS